MRLARGAGLVVALVVLILAFALPPLLGWEVHTRTPQSAHPLPVPPLHGWWEPTLWGPGTLSVLILAGLGWLYGESLAMVLSWRRLLALAYGTGLAWLLALALVDGTDGLTRVLGSKHEYLITAREVTDIPALLSGFIAQIPIDSPDNWPTHIAGHPPGALLFFVALARLGLGGDLAAALVVTAIAATIPLAVMTTLRTLAALDPPRSAQRMGAAGSGGRDGSRSAVPVSEVTARRAAPFLVLAPAAVFMAVSADALFAAIGCWAAATLACAVRADRHGRRGSLLAWGGLSGVLFGYGVFCSYGFGLLGCIALAILIAGRSWRPILPVVIGGLVVTAIFAVGGFAWWEAYPVLRERYWDGIAADRPGSYWVWANLAALLISAGPLIGPGIGQALGQLRRPLRPAVLLVLGACLAILVADLSQMSKSEVERIWLLFIPWLLVSCALLPPTWRRWGLGLQLLTAVAVQHLLYTSW